MARWNSVIRWSNRFVSLSVMLLMAACQSAPSAEAPPVEHGTAVPAAGSTDPAPVPANPAAAASAPAATGSAAVNTAPVPPQAAQRYADALAFMRAGQAADAEVVLKQLIAAYPEFAGPEVNLGLLYLQDSRLTEAETAFKAALERNPANAVAGNELGIVERKLGKFAEAEAAYQRTIAAEPNYAPAYLNLGVLYDLYLAEPQKALEQFEHYIQLAGENKQVAGWVVELRKRVGAPAPAAKKEPA
jgi:tetratricopeptide (TPR) repeat protein